MKALPYHNEALFGITFLQGTGCYLGVVGHHWTLMTSIRYWVGSHAKTHRAMWSKYVTNVVRTLKV